jgi:general secretion pathway protein G
MSWVELAVVLLIYSIVLSVLAGRLLYYQELAEKTGVQYQAVLLKSALREKMAELIIHNREIAIPALAEQNPMNWLERPPANYCGETRGDPEQDRPAGCWYFDRNGRVLTYLVNSGSHFAPDSAGRKRIRYRVQLLRSEGGTPGVDMQLLEPYHWLE